MARMPSEIVSPSGRSPLLVATLAALALLPFGLRAFSPRAEAALPAATTPVLPHPHFPKRLECRLPKDVVLELAYQTASFNAEKAKGLAVGKVWHLAGATLRCSHQLSIGGREVPAGEHALSARRTEAGFELVLHAGKGFSTDLGDAPHVLATDFTADAERFEHLSIDVQPGGAKERTELFLEVRFDTMRARARIELSQ